MKDLAFLLHMYQPPWQFDDVLQKIHHECYSWLTKWLADSSFKVTININYSLTEQLVNNGLEDVIDNIQRGVENGSIELTGSGAYHPILPLIPKSEARRQIELNHKKNKEVFGDLWNPKGFFPPEMAFSNDLVKIVKDVGYEWIITDALVYEAVNDSEIPNNFVASIYGLPVFFKSGLSNNFAFNLSKYRNANTENFVKWIHRQLPDESYSILSFDIETIGHHCYFTEDSMNFLKGTMDYLRMENVTVSDILSDFPKRSELIREGNEKYTGSWSTKREDILANNPFPLWNDPKNPLHKFQWQLINYAINLISKSDNENARNLLDKALNSCPLWWASEKYWNPGNILHGMNQLIEAIRMVNPDDYILKKIYSKINNNIMSKTK